MARIEWWPMRWRRKAAQAVDPDPAPQDRVRVLRNGAGEYEVEALSPDAWDGTWRWFNLLVKFDTLEEAASRAEKLVETFRREELRRTGERTVVWP